MAKKTVRSGFKWVNGSGPRQGIRIRSQAGHSCPTKKKKSQKFCVQILGSGSGSCFFRQWSDNMPTKNWFIFAYYFLKVRLHQFSQIKKQSQNSRNQGFSYIVLLDGRTRIRIRTKQSGRPKKMRIRIPNTGYKCYLLAGMLLLESECILCRCLEDIYDC